MTYSSSRSARMTALVVVLAMLVSVAAVKLVPITVVNKTDQAVSVTLADILSDPAEPTVLFYFSVDPGLTKVFEIPKGKYLVQGFYCGEYTEWLTLNITGRHTIAVPACGAQSPVQNDGAWKWLHSAKPVFAE